MDKQRDVAVIVGSLRKGSFNRQIANALVALAPAELALGIVEIGHLPLYNADLDENPPAPGPSFAAGSGSRTRAVRDARIQSIHAGSSEECPGRGDPALWEERLERQAGGGGEFGAGRDGRFRPNHHLRQSLVFLNVPAMAQPEAYIGGVDKLLGADGALVNAGPNFPAGFMQAYARWVARTRAMSIPKIDWNKAFEFAWRILVFIVAIGILIVVSTNWNRWEGGAGWQGPTMPTCRRTPRRYPPRWEATCGNSRFRISSGCARVRSSPSWSTTITAPPWLRRKPAWRGHRASSGAEGAA